VTPNLHDFFRFGVYQRATVSGNLNINLIELPIVLWNHGLISLKQLGSLFDWSLIG
jgi:Protein of unknown function (DUF2949)